MRRDGPGLASASSQTLAEPSGKLSFILVTLIAPGREGSPLTTRHPHGVVCKNVCAHYHSCTPPTEPGKSDAAGQEKEAIQGEMMIFFPAQISRRH